MYKDKAEQREYQKEWIRNRRDEWINDNGPCQTCGSDDRLEVDHVDRSKKLLSPAKLWSMSRDNPKRISELAKCQVLCFNCHKAKTSGELSKSCTERKVEQKGCKCDRCKKLHLDRVSKWRSKVNASDDTGISA